MPSRFPLASLASWCCRTASLNRGTHSEGGKVHFKEGWKKEAGALEFQPITVKQRLFRLDRQAAHQGGDVLPRPSNEKLRGKLQTTGTRWRRRVDFVALETLWPLITDRDEFATPGRDALTRPASSASRPPQQTDRPALPPPRGDDGGCPAPGGSRPNLVLPEGVAPMHLAAGLEQENGIRGLRLLLQHGGDPNVRSGEGLTPLHVAASWGCTACLGLLLTEGGDPHLEDQDGNSAFDLAVEQGNATCVNILQDGGWNSSFPQRRAESFLTTIMEDSGQTGLGNSLTYPSGRLPLFSLKEAHQHGEPPGTFRQPGGATPNSVPGPCTQDRSASSFLTECSWRGDTILDLADFGVQPLDSPNAFLPPRKPASSCADVQNPWDSEVGRSLSDAGVKQSWGIRASAEEGCSSPPGPGTALGGPLSLVGSEGLSFRPDMPCTAGSPQKTLPSASLGTRPGPEAAPLRHPQDANACGLSQGCGSLDPGLSVTIPSQDGLDITCLGHLAESTAVSDLGKIVVDPASVLGVSGTLDGCSGRGRSLGKCSAASTDRYLSCISECYASAVEGPGYGYVHEWEDRKAAPSGPAGGCNTSNGGSGRGPPACMGTGLRGQRILPTRGAARIFPGSQDLALPHSKNTWEVSQRRERSMMDPPENEAPWEGSAWGTEGPTETWGLPVRRQEPALFGAREELAEVGMRGLGLGRSALPTSPRQAGEGQPSSPTQDTIPVQWTSEGRNHFRGCGGPLGPSSTLGGTEMAPSPLAIVGEEPPSALDAQLRSMMLATKVAHSPLLPSNRKCCPAPPCPQSPLIGALPQQSLSTASLFEEPLEMPRRPRRVRRGPGPRGAASLSRSPPPAREAEETGEGRAVSAVPSCRKMSSNPGPGPWGCSLASSRGDPSRRTELGAGKPSSGDAAQGCPEVGRLESLGVRGSLGKRAEETSRVSFSRLSGRGPSATCPPGRLSPICQEVPLSPGGRPANLSATEPVEYLYVDEEEGQTLIERHLPPTDDSGASSCEDTLVCDWRACARAAVGRQGNGERAPLNPEYLTDEALARKLRELGADPGPVTPLTRKLYVQLLERLSRDPETPARKGSAAYSPELASALDTYRIPTSKADEMALAAEFDRPDKSRRWRGGLLKSSFNYLLLDPRVTQNLPARCQLLSPDETFRTFVRAIFYVGKGTRGRPYRHLYEALTHYREGQGTPACPQVSSKVQHILEIWAGGQGVVSMHCFQNVVPVEAYTREACMVDAIGLKMLTNQKKGNYYGLVVGWPMKRRRSLGVFLLHRALRIFLAEGERQLRPADI
ncbi:ankyrin repeat and LEM domain-containing protein 1 [Pantherophis guttatus]|uniref:Ankyrin repeat and LEM domain-containing protein 1 n=1 Tax=Pantherophis guttatus TaxID=94885 RepID=A0ABM3YNB1_PANGU|nr:ankyrin repeat and LEM domain-containing protein 1 [Pantherophis guttatus]